MPLDQRTLPALLSPTGWRAPRAAADRPLPSFFLHETYGANYSHVRQRLHEIIGNHLAEETVPIASAQYLVDLPLMDALERHPKRTYDPEAAEWHILGATPFSSRLLTMLERNVSADIQNCCDSSGCHKCGRADMASHHERNRLLVEHLEHHNKWWRRRGVPFVLLSTGISINQDLGDKLLAVLRARNRDVGPVVIGGVDRSGIHARQEANHALLKRMVVLPHVASPECALHAKLCSRGRNKAHSQADRASPRSALAGINPAMNSPAIDWASAVGCRVPSAAGKGEGEAARLANVVGQQWRPNTIFKRDGFIFHGDNGRYDFGARGAVRNMAAHLRTPHSFVGLRLMNTAEASKSRSAAHSAHRTISQHTTSAMLNASICFVPQGDTDTSRRLFDALSTGCVPVIIKVNGGKPRHTMMANLPFHHSLDWRALAHFLSAGLANIGEREREGVGMLGERVVSCRRQEAAQLDRWHADVLTLSQMRRNAIEAFSAHLNVEVRPRGVCDAFLRELAYILTDLPGSLFLPPPHVLPLGMKEWENMTSFAWLWK